ncbi:putative pterin-4-alpha-carbinolamine dehydratase [Spatholobus suberectus]|nr:putative pterin-4-alpha-carbinolamine dehydratase [Spatholobus suberectus]
MNRLLLVRHPVLALSVSNAKLPLSPFFQTYSYPRRRNSTDSGVSSLPTSTATFCTTNKGHHPDLHLVGWNNVTVEIWTHSVGGLTQNDFILAAKINGLNVHDLLRRKASG